jgi:hypothetical protein
MVALSFSPAGGRAHRLTRENGREDAHEQSGDVSNAGGGRLVLQPYQAVVLELGQ